MRMNRIIGIGLAALALSACTKAGSGTSDTKEVDRVPVDFALSLGGSSAGTKADVTKLLELAATPGFRGLSSVRVIPFALNGSDIEAVSGNNTSNDWLHNLPAISNVEDTYASQDGYTYHQGLIKGNNAHLYSGADANLPIGTTHVLVYAHPDGLSANSTQEYKHLNGSVIEYGINQRQLITPSTITFSPDPIFTGTIPEAAQGIADVLNAIAKDASFTQTYYYERNNVWYTSSVGVNWNNIGSSELNDLFKSFTNSGEQTTGAGENVTYLIANLYAKLKEYHSTNYNPYKHVIGTEEFTAMLTNGGSDPLTYAEMYNKMRDVLLARIQSLTGNTITIDTDGNVAFVDPSLNTYPVSLGLPAGSAVVRWSGSEFQVVTEALDGIAPIDRFCYMPSLYFYSNSTIRTSTDKEIYDQYRYVDENTNWASVLSQYRAGKKITKRTASVAIENPLQYGLGLLVVTLKASTVMLPDNDGDVLTYSFAQGNNFPVTGIIVGGQYRQHFDFTPDNTTAEYYMYDNQVSGVYLTTEESPQIRTLVFPTLVDKDIFFFLEFRNDSGSPFYGAEGIIMPGSHFYLAGKLEKPSDTDKAEGLTSVIMQDHFTSVSCVVSTLENAHISVPELSNPQLALGVHTQTDWINSAASYIVLD